MKHFLLSLAFAAITMSVSAADETNLLSNGDFETWSEGVPTYWKSTSTASSATLSQSTDAHAGTYAVQAATASKNKRLAHQEIFCTAGTYVFSFYAKSASSEALSTVKGGYVPVADKVGSYVYGKNVSLSATEWTLVTDTFQLTADTTACFLVCINQSTGDALVDDASLIKLASTETSEGGETTGNDETGVITIADAQAVEANTSVKVKGLVCAVGTKGFLMGDATGYIYTYYNNHSYAVGDSLLVEGAVSEYGGFKQFTNTATFTKTATGQTVTHPTAVTLDGTAADAYLTTPVIEFVTMTGTLNISGSYYNVTIDGASTAVGSLLSPTSDLVAKLVNGATVTVKGYAAYVSGTKYVNIVVTDVVSAGESTLTSIANTLETAYTTAEAIALIKAGTNDLSDTVYVKGTISKIDSFNDSYGSITYWLDDNSFEVYAGLNLDGTKFSAMSDLSIGDEVVVKGIIKEYNGTYEFDKNNCLAKITKTVNPVELVDPSNTPETAYTTAKAIEMIDAGTYDLSKAVYVTGTISKIDGVYNNTITYWLDNDAFEVYNGKGLDGADVADSTYLHVGDVVVVSGKLTKYKATYEFKAGSILYSCNGSTETALNAVSADAAGTKVIYNLLGQRVDAISGKGIYIVNGKKIIVR